MGPAGLNLAVDPSVYENTSSGNSGPITMLSGVFSTSYTGGFSPVTYSWHSIVNGTFVNPTNASSQRVQAVVGLWETVEVSAVCTITDAQGNQSSENILAILRNYGSGPIP